LNFFSLFKRKLIYKFKRKISIDNNNFQKKSLDELFNYYGSDKGSRFKKNNSIGHGFSDYYVQNLNNIRDKKINILEIGSYSGASACAFSNYFTNSKIFCFDINISNFEYTSKNIFVYDLDINNKKKVKKTLDKIFNENNFTQFDLIIDDGSHNLRDIIFSLNLFFQYLKNNSFYIIEDYKYPNYYSYNRNIDHILVDEVLQKIKEKINFESSIIDKESQKILMNSIKTIETHKGSLKDSDICFIKKK